MTTQQPAVPTVSVLIPLAESSSALYRFWQFDSLWATLGSKLPEMSSGDQLEFERLGSMVDELAAAAPAHVQTIRDVMNRFPEWFD